MWCHAQYIHQGESQLGAAAQDLAGHRWQQLYCASLVLYILVIIIIIRSFSVLLKSLHLNPKNFTFFLPNAIGEGEQANTCVVFSCLLN